MGWARLGCAIAGSGDQTGSCGRILRPDPAAGFCCGILLRDPAAGSCCGILLRTEGPNASIACRTLCSRPAQPSSAQLRASQSCPALLRSALGSPFGRSRRPIRRARLVRRGECAGRHSWHEYHITDEQGMALWWVQSNHAINIPVAIKTMRGGGGVFCRQVGHFLPKAGIRVVKDKLLPVPPLFRVIQVRRGGGEVGW